MLAARVRTHFCRTALGTLDRLSLIGLASTGTEHVAFPQDPIFDFCAFFDVLGEFSPRSSRFSAPFVEPKIVARVFVRAQRCFTGFYDKILRRKNPFFQDQLQNLSIVSAIFGHKFQNDLHRGQPLAVLRPNKSIWHVCRVFRFLGYLVQK